MLKVKCVLVLSNDDSLISDVEQACAVCMPEASIQTANTKQNVKQLVRYQQPEAIILDLSTFDINGFNVLADIRQVSQVPLITLSYTRDESILVRALEMGADRHITRPIGQLEFIARMKAFFRRRELITQI